MIGAINGIKNNQNNPNTAFGGVKIRIPAETKNGILKNDSFIKESFVEGEKKITVIKEGGKMKILFHKKDGNSVMFDDKIDKFMQIVNLK